MVRRVGFSVFQAKKADFSDEKAPFQCPMHMCSDSQDSLVLYLCSNTLWSFSVHAQWQPKCPCAMTILLSWNFKCLLSCTVYACPLRAMTVLLPIHMQCQPYSSCKLFIRGLSCPCSVWTSLIQNCLMLSLPGFPYNLLPVSCVYIGFSK